MKSKRTLIICDDDSVDIKLFKKHLGINKLDQFNILEAHSSDDLLFLLNNKELNIDLIFLDVYLGETNGLELLKEIKAKNKVPIIMLTGRGDETMAVECMKEGASDYIPKDILMNYDIERTINLAIHRWEIEQERDQLLGIAAHELRNPLSVILGFSEILKDDDFDEATKKEIYDTLHQAANHTLNIINELLDITRIEKGIIEIKKIKGDLIPVVRKKTEDYKYIADKKKIILEFSTELPELIKELDINRIEEVLSNLIDNAIKYSPQNTIVHVSVSTANNKAEIRIKDHGLGIKENELQYLFSLFSTKKISTLPTGNEARTGLGLAICKKVIDAHNGEIIVESELGQGTTFTILLP